MAAVVAVVTDSTACLPADLVAGNGIRVVPLRVVLAGRAVDEGPPGADATECRPGRGRGRGRRGRGRDGRRCGGSAAPRRAGRHGQPGAGAVRRRLRGGRGRRRRGDRLRSPLRPAFRHRQLGHPGRAQRPRARPGGGLPVDRDGPGARRPVGRVSRAGGPGRRCGRHRGGRPRGRAPLVVRAGFRGPPARRRPPRPARAAGQRPDGPAAAACPGWPDRPAGEGQDAVGGDQAAGAAGRRVRGGPAGGRSGPVPGRRRARVRAGRRWRASYQPPATSTWPPRARLSALIPAPA